MSEKISGRWQLPLALVLIAALTVAVYWPALNNEFLSYDDPDYVTLNMMVRQGLTIKGFTWAFSAFHAGNWHPLTWLSHMLDIELFDLNPWGHHATNLVLHTINSVLLCALLHRLTGVLGRSLLIAMLFAIHPLHVESVAWVAERKDLLSTLFWLLTMWAYAGYARRPSTSRYLAVAMLLGLGLMAKQMLVTVPFILLLMDYWPLQRLTPTQGESPIEWRTIRNLLVEKIPLLLMCIAASLVTLRAQDSAGALSHGNGQSIIVNAGNAMLSYVKYIRNMFWPVDLALFYPFDVSAVTGLKVAGAVFLLAGATGFVIARGKRYPYLVFGWFWYLITLLPVIGFIKIGGQAMADRYTYIPLIGLFLMVTWGGVDIAGTWRKGLLAAGVGVAVVIAVISFLTVSQIRSWRNSFDLYGHALAVVKNNWLAHNNMGILLAQHYRHEEAIVHFSESVRINPDAAGFRNLGNAYQMAQRNFEAISAFREAVRIDPENAQGRYLLGYAYLMSGNRELAYQEYLQLMRLNESQARPLLDSIRMSGG